MIDEDFYKNDTDYYKEYQMMQKADFDVMRDLWKILRNKALKSLNDELHSQGRSGSIGGTDVEDEELYKYLKGEEKILFKKYSRILDFQIGYTVSSYGLKEKFSVKRFKDIKNESLITEGIRFNSTYLSLPDGEYNLNDVLSEVNELKITLESWLKEGWKTVTAMDNEHKEIIPFHDFPKKFK